MIVGAARPTNGAVSFEGHNLHAEYASLRSRIGMVPQDDVVHHQLTINQALGFAAELRMPPDTTKRDRQQVIAQVLEELELTPHADTRVDKLSGGQRKRASVALELLTGPSLLVLDEPTSGLDPALDRQVMTMLRQLADAGRVIVVVTHSLAFLDVCDQVLLLAPGGKTAFIGPPAEIGPTMGATDWADIFTDISADPGGAQQRFLNAPNIWSRLQRSRRAGETHRLGQTRAHQPMAPVLNDRTPPGAAHRRRPRLLPVPGVAAAHRRSASAHRGRSRRLRQACARECVAERAKADLGVVELRRGFHGDRADCSRVDRRTADLPP